MKTKILLPKEFFHSGEKWMFFRSSLGGEDVLRLVKTSVGYRLYCHWNSNNWIGMKVDPRIFGFRYGMEIPIEQLNDEWICWTSQVKDYRGKGETNRFTISVSQQDKREYLKWAELKQQSLSAFVREAVQFYIEENRLELIDRSVNESVAERFLKLQSSHLLP